MRLPCPVCSSIDSTAVTWYYSQTEISTSELNITEGAKCTLKESGKRMNNANCSDFNFYKFKLETAADSYLCHIVTPLELSKHCRVEGTRNATVCDSGMAVCTYGQPQTDSQCVAQIITTPILPSTTLSTQTNFTAVSEPTPSVSPSSTGCTLGRVSCHIAYLAVGLGALAVIVVLLVVVVIVLACISVKRGKMKMQSE